MPYIESHQELGRHPKTRRLARLLSVSLPCAVGHLQFLWWWAMDYAQDGEITKFDAFDIADAAGWEGDPDTFLDALIGCGIGDGAGFVERCEEGVIRLHDWQDYGGKLFTERRKNAEKQSRYRDSKNTPVPETIPQKSRNRNVTVTSPVTLKERRGEESIGEEILPTGRTTTRAGELPQPSGVYSPELPLPLAVQEFIQRHSEGDPKRWEEELRLDLAGRELTGPPSAYMLGILRRWTRDGGPPKPEPRNASGQASRTGERLTPAEQRYQREMAKINEQYEQLAAIELGQAEVSPEDPFALPPLPAAADSHRVIVRDSAFERPTNAAARLARRIN